MSWSYVLFAAIVEIFWVIGLRYSETLLHWVGTGVAILFSFVFIIKACEKLPSGTVYAVFTGLGAVSIVIINFLVFEVELTPAETFFILLILIGVIGLKLTTVDQVEEMQTEGLKEGEGEHGVDLSRHRKLR